MGVPCSGSILLRDAEQGLAVASAQAEPAVIESIDALAGRSRRRRDIGRCHATDVSIAGAGPTPLLTGLRAARCRCRSAAAVARAAAGGRLAVLDEARCRVARCAARTAAAEARLARLVAAARHARRGDAGQTSEVVVAGPFALVPLTVLVPIAGGASAGVQTGLSDVALGPCRVVGLPGSGIRVEGRDALLALPPRRLLDAPPGIGRRRRRVAVSVRGRGARCGGGGGSRRTVALVAGLPKSPRRRQRRGREPSLCAGAAGGEAVESPWAARSGRFAAARAALARQAPPGRRRRLPRSRSGWRARCRSAGSGLGCGLRGRRLRGASQGAACRFSVEGLARMNIGVWTPGVTPLPIALDIREMVLTRLIRPCQSLLHSLERGSGAACRRAWARTLPQYH
mmetsp:Transcript_9611/g.34132  ORF Transcript_9611/g.34132 Transcript_9611/m.34132 type:complete len:399 (+) Transcript_9611:4330-5526(+)